MHEPQCYSSESVQPPIYPCAGKSGTCRQPAELPAFGPALCPDCRRRADAAISAALHATRERAEAWQRYN